MAEIEIVESVYKLVENVDGREVVDFIKTNAPQDVVVAMVNEISAARGCVEIDALVWDLEDEGFKANVVYGGYYGE